MHAKAQPPLIDEVNLTEDAIDEAIASVAAEGSPDLDRMVPVSLTTSRRGFLRGALAVAGGTAAAAALAACAPASGSAWSYAPLRTLTAAAEATEVAQAEGEAEAAVATTEPMTEETGSTEPLPDGWTEHDMAAREKVRRFVGNLAGPLGMSEYLGEPEQDPEFTMVEHGNQPLEPTRWTGRSTP
jgi:hypothetical protein